MDKRKRYQIFVSSTFTDLEEERGKVMETILSFDCFPAGMELFPAMDEEQFKYIKRIIDDSDYYLLIIGGRYGSVDKDGVSWTEKEYDYAVEKGIPVMVFDHKDFTQLLANKTDQDGKKRRKLIKFKKKAAGGKLINYWTNADDLALAVAKSLKKVLELQPRIGWVRADSLVSGEEHNEIERLKKEIDDRLTEIRGLQTGVEGFKADLKKKDEDYQQEIGRLNGQIKSLEARLEIYRTLYTETVTVNGVSFRMVLVEGGTFMMGADDNDINARENEKPAHEVTLSDYWIGETQVTKALWRAVMGDYPSRFHNDPEPVESVSWDDCQKFIKELNMLTGKKFHLPTEAQWEFAARGGNKSKGYKYAGSNDIEEVAWYNNNCHIDGYPSLHPVGELKPNELGLYDMTGNVWEWCQDRYVENYYMNSPTNNPTGSKTGIRRVTRGGAYGEPSSSCRVSFRYGSKPVVISMDLGLRLAL